MPTIKIKLKDPKYCQMEDMTDCICLMLWKTSERMGMACKALSTKDNIIWLETENGKSKRPQACIDKFGE